MNNTKSNQLWLDEIIIRALNEDIGTGDVTSESIIPADVMLNGKIMAKETGVVAGVEVAKRTFRLVDPTIVFDTLIEDGCPVTKGDAVVRLSGPALSILKGERVALNFLQRMSGIASLTAKFSACVVGTNTKILDTRKTVPGLRLIDKWAVRLGGGHNHRIGLYDMALIKENHITAAGGITAAVECVRTQDDEKRPIEVEVTNLDELQEALLLRIDRIMLDNMSLDEMRQAVEMTNGSTMLEASGNVTLETVGEIAQTGVNYISSGSLTHSVKALDLSLILDR